MSRKASIAIIILFAAAVLGVAKWLRGVHHEDDEPWDFEAEGQLDQTLTSPRREEPRGMAKQPCLDGRDA
jgi:hypothetical protein